MFLQTTVNVHLYCSLKTWSMNNWQLQQAFPLLSTKWWLRRGLYNNDDAINTEQWQLTWTRIKLYCCWSWFTNRSIESTLAERRGLKTVPVVLPPKVLFGGVKRVPMNLIQTLVPAFKISLQRFLGTVPAVVTHYSFWLSNWEQGFELSFVNFAHLSMLYNTLWDMTFRLPCVCVLASCFTCFFTWCVLCSRGCLESPPL